MIERVGVLSRGDEAAVEPAGRHRLRLPRMHDEEGFTTIAMAVAILISLSLLFSAAQIYRLNSAAAEIQEVADAAALAAENVVAEYMVAVRLCDALSLSMSLLALCVFGVSVVLLCIPPAATLAGDLISLGERIVTARNDFARTCSEGLTKLQGMLPFLGAAQAAWVAASNNDSLVSGVYVAAAVLVPTEAEPVQVSAPAETEAVRDAVEEHRDDLSSAAAEAEAAAAEADEAKQRGFERDCGAAPGYCMQERADHLAGLSSADNPHYASVDLWSFDVALKRAQKYYQARAAGERPANDSLDEQQNSALRSVFFNYAVQEMAKGYVRDDGTNFEAYFPELPANTDQMRQSGLYTQAVFPITTDGETSTMHAWSGCPAAAGAVATGSIAQMEAGAFKECEQCRFKASDLGKVAAASSSIANGFEYHYRAVAQAARDYEAARKRLAPARSQAQGIADQLFEQVKSALRSVGGSRITATPPGYKGAVAMVANVASMAVDEGLASSFVNTSATLGPRAAVSASTLVSEDAGETGSVLASLLDRFDQDAGGAVGAGRVVLSIWSRVLLAYNDAPNALQSAIDGALDGVPLLSKAGIGQWAADRLREVRDALGLEPADLDALKPVLVNSARVTEADDGVFSVKYSQIKAGAERLSGPTTSLFQNLIGDVQTTVDGWLDQAEAGVQIAEIKLPIGDITLPITLALPPQLSESARGWVGEATAALGNLVGSISGVRVWY